MRGPTFLRKESGGSGPLTRLENLTPAELRALIADGFWLPRRAQRRGAPQVSCSHGSSPTADLLMWERDMKYRAFWGTIGE
jgi:hypothetical protein